jgi:hypothetical protein
MPFGIGAVEGLPVFQEYRGWMPEVYTGLPVYGYLPATHCIQVDKRKAMVVQGEAAEVDALVGDLCIG